MNFDLLQLYRKSENKREVHVDNSYQFLVSPTDNLDLPIHNWYKFKEAYSPAILKKILRYSKLNSKVKLLDPFCGSGTTFLSASLDPEVNLHCGLGIEVNPFIHFMSRTKLNFYKLNIEKADKIIQMIKSYDLYKINTCITVPTLSTVQKAYSKATLNQLLNLKMFIKNNLDIKEYEHDFFMLAFASILEPVSCMKKSGRALKIVRAIQDHDIKQIYLNKVIQMIEDVKGIRNNAWADNINIVNADVRNYLPKDTSQYNLAVFSPPYLNNFDYSEVYKLELWMLDFIDTQDDFRSLRYRTIRSHGSLKFDPTDVYQQHNSEILKEMIYSLDNAEQQEHFYPLIKGYIDDMYKTFSLINDLTNYNTTVACIVANSLFGSRDNNNLTPVATDLLICEVAEDLGFEVTEIKVARKIARRGVAFPYGRESVIFLKRKRQHVEYVNGFECAR